MYKLVTIVGTRPEIIRLSSTIKLTDKIFNHILVHTGQNWDKNLSDIFFSELEIRKPDYFLGVVGSNLGKTIGNIISKSYELLLELKPDALLVLGDTNSCLSALSAKRLKIPVFHIESGNRSFDENLPEEINRRIIDHISDINMSYSENARRNLLSEGLKPDRVFVVGSPMTEVLTLYSDKINKSIVLDRLKLKKNNYILLSSHREENLDIPAKFDSLIDTINEIANKLKMPIIFSCHPRTKNKLTEKNIILNEFIMMCEPFGFFDYCHLQKNAYCVLTDSGSCAEEASILGFPAVSFRDSCERQEAIDKGNMMIVGDLNRDNVLKCIEIIKKTYDPENKTIPYDYLDINVSAKIVKIIQSHIPIINSLVWRK